MSHPFLSVITSKQHQSSAFLHRELFHLFHMKVASVSFVNDFICIFLCVLQSLVLLPSTLFSSLPFPLSLALYFFLFLCLFIFLVFYIFSFVSSVFFLFVLQIKLMVFHVLLFFPVLSLLSSPVFPAFLSSLFLFHYYLPLPLPFILFLLKEFVFLLFCSKFPVSKRCMSTCRVQYYIT